MDPVGRITILNETIYGGKYRLARIKCRPFSLGDIFTMVDKFGEHTVVVSPIEGIHRCDGCMLQINSPNTDIMDCSCCTEDGWFPCVGASRRRCSDSFIFKPASELMEEL